MKTLVFALVVVAACGGKKDSTDKTVAASPDQKAAVDRYMNTDMQHAWAVLWNGVRPLKTLKDDAGAEGWVQGAMPDIVIPRMTEFLAAAAKVTVPPVLAESHAMIVGVATSYRDIAKDLLDAANAKDSVKFKAAHTRMLETRVRYAAWEKAIDQVLAASGVTFADVPQLPDEPKPVPTPVTYCGDAACPCAAGSETKDGDKLTGCTLSTATTIQGHDCAAGTITFHPGGLLKSCVFAAGGYYQAGEATFFVDGKIASANSALLAAAYGDTMCGPGPARWFSTGEYAACTLVTARSPETYGGLEIPARTNDAHVVFHPGGKLRYIKYKSQERCLDEAGAPVTPCKAPTW